MTREAFLTNRLAERGTELENLKAAVREFLDAEEAVEAEGRRAEANGGKGWSSAPVVRRTYAIAEMRRAVGQPVDATSTE